MDWVIDSKLLKIEMQIHRPLLNSINQTTAGE